MASPKADAPQVGLKFVGHDAIGLPVKRKQVHQACSACKRRKVTANALAFESSSTCKKRRLTDNDVNPEKPVPPTRRANGAKRHSTTLDRDASDAASQLLQFRSQSIDILPITPSTAGLQPQPDSAAPFLGDLNPEGILIEGTMTSTSITKPAVQPGKTGPGIWFEAAAAGTTLPWINAPHYPDVPVTTSIDDDTRRAYLSLPHSGDTRIEVPVANIGNFLKLGRTAFVQELAYVVRPSETSWRALKRIYMLKIHPIFPIFEESSLMISQSDSIIDDLVKAAVCLAAANDPEAAKHLFLNTIPKDPGEGPGQPSRIPVLTAYPQYSKTVVKFIKEGLPHLQSSSPSENVFSYIRIAAVTCLFWQPEPQCRFAPLDLFAVVVRMVHTYGIHIDPAVQQAYSEPGSEGIDHGKIRLFKCLYALDRLVSALSGRPVMFHNYDLLTVPQPEEKDEPSFKLFMSLIALLDKVIELYRPKPEFNHIDVPVLERLILEAGAQHQPVYILATLEVLYHAICVLSVRMPRDRFKTSPDDDAQLDEIYPHLPPSVLNARRSHSSDRIFDGITGHDIGPMPWVPYALALSLSVEYRKWRFSRTPMFRTRAGETFKKMLPVLKKLSKIWTSARINSDLGDAVITNLSRAEHNMRRNKGQASTSRTQEQESTHTDVEPTHGVAIAHQFDVTINPADGGVFDTFNKNQMPDPATDSGIPSGPQPGLSTGDTSSTAASFFASSNGLGSELWDDQGSGTSFGSVPEIPDETLFQSLDQNLMNTVDWSFGSNLDPGWPLSWSEYSTGGPDYSTGGFFDS
ncbi:hypothetical protein B0H63DRAFT_393639 [Podospora didyma]|uniref:Transcription factor domain-containing protein n=1 Tax=Podospora didyma TaxID=330526 RepID=A0AAE0NQ16_9PEZI|nr:hypothetical protein B0H63DRAFT_393639 [Podospora didyma]